ncbi:protein ENHANCED PSEUDOMONAS SUSCEPTIBILITY 1-like [Juglans microcarpa x Juglans regia]|uniref:protein ENHANCED PSEUDOMONAS SUSCEPTIBILITY 1-like n=1 Tax=Juglans microcarpa x Juglans regia TaxID=2249226 RepID=UPI001B7E5768|nr:protein ENHANCED PSEUDOMONAS SUSCEPTIBILITY 1-like [Juglans microcarpa x Juglans regia]
MQKNMVRFLSTNTIRSTSNSIRRMELTPWDLNFLLQEHMQGGLLFRLKPQHLQEQAHHLPKNDVINRLKASLSRTLDIFYPLAGRLVMIENDDKTASFFVDCNNHGVQFVHAVADGVTVADILDPIYVPQIVESFFLMNRALNYEGTNSKPLLSVQVTVLVDGFFIGCSLNHAVADGASFWHFFNTWSEISRGSYDVKSTPLPIFERSSFFDGIIDFPIHIPNPYKENVERVVHPPLQQRYFHFPKEKIAELKAKANAEVNTNKISSLQALLGYFWLSITRSRRLNDDQEVQYLIAVGARQRMHPPLPNQYFGNAAQAVMVTSTAGDLIQHGHGWAAWHINNLLASKIAEDQRKILVDWSKNPRMVKFSGMRSTKLLTGNSPRFNVYGNDFGWGRPVAVRNGVSLKFEGNLTVFPGKEEGSIDFEACLLPETLDAMAKDAEFMHTITS